MKNIIKSILILFLYCGFSYAGEGFFPYDGYCWSTECRQFMVPCPGDKGIVTSTVTVMGIDWIGHPMVSDNDPYTPSEGWIPGIEIGLRSDGVVVWRKKKE
jgi:hypothetical protein